MDGHIHLATVPGNGAVGKGSQLVPIVQTGL